MDKEIQELSDLRNQLRPLFDRWNARLRDAAPGALLQSMSDQNGCIEIRVHKSLKTPTEYVVYGTWDTKEAWDHAHQTEEFRTQFRKLPIETHTLTSASFYELAYAYKGT